jgi:carbon-monoxide dehydrogenase medium subunit
MGSAPERGAVAEQSVVGAAAGDLDATEVGEAAVATLGSVPSDIHASDAYRRRVGAVMVARAWRQAVEEAQRV